MGRGARGEGRGDKVIKVLRFGDERSVALGQSLCDELERATASAPVRISSPNLMVFIFIFA